MRKENRALFLSTVLLCFSVAGYCSDLVKIPAGSYTPLYSESEQKKTVDVQGFYLDMYPVTNQAFLAFVTQQPHWRKSQVVGLFADSAYLQSWKSDRALGRLNPRSPVTYVSWFAAKAYCKWANKRLPAVDEWEYAAQSNGKKVFKKILDWYSRPTLADLPPVGSTFKNTWGVYDMHGLIWEWVLDFNTTFITGESRGDSALERKLYCGAGALRSSDPKDYAAFMRYGFRSSLQARYCVANLGFRCAQ